MDMGSINWLAILACVVAAQGIGFIWYSKPVLLNPWLKSIGKKQNITENANPMTYILTILAAVIIAIFLTFVIAAMGGTDMKSGVTAGLMIWIGFVATTSATNALFGQRGMKNWLIESGNHLVTLLVFGAILGSWQ